MTIEDALKRGVDAINRHDLDAFVAGYAPNATVHDPMYPEPLRGRDAIREDMRSFLAAFPDLSIKIVNVVPGGNTIAAELRNTGTNTGAMSSPDGEFPATNKRIDQAMALFAEVGADGLITSERRYFDMAAMMVQLGLMPEGTSA